MPVSLQSLLHRQRQLPQRQHHVQLLLLFFLYITSICLCHTHEINIIDIFSVCCPALNGQNYPRERPPAGSSAAGFDQCAILDRHSAKGYCPRSGMIVCFAAPFTNAAETVLQFIGSNQAVLATFTGHRKATADVICSSQGQWLVAGSNGGSVPFSFLTCSQDTLFTNDNVDVDDILEYRNSGGYGRNQNEDRYSRRRSDESGKSSDSEDDDFRL